ncbi:uncharacterized protein N0V89_001852 [Didymosphaeria variabile]|uniref:Uncharacterized protein n=1 Tax=Didymosphaeria variabile TaxID=1932322 RepID=A0A9W9CDU0_9PLEO|nr:uncharacterized protein N0V89_001852 [Didymosphaeria variabile]KAJ4357277.1 hypothetical protein N0V89_001852 [Didymosphaeria variabile]
MGTTTLEGVGKGALATTGRRPPRRPPRRPGALPADETGAKDEAPREDALGTEEGLASKLRTADCPTETPTPTLKLAPMGPTDTAAATADETRGLEVAAKGTGVGTVENLVDDELGIRLLTTPMGIKAMSPLVTPSVAPSVVPKPPTTLPTTPVTPFNEQVQAGCNTGKKGCLEDIRVANDLIKATLVDDGGAVGVSSAIAVSAGQSGSCTGKTTDETSE